MKLNETKRLISVFAFLLIINIYFVSALSVNIPTNVLSGNGSLINVNNSLYWQGHTGTDGSWLTGILFNYNQTYSGSTYNATYHTWAYNQTFNPIGYAKYQFLNNNFNGTGNITTTGTIQGEQLTSTDDMNYSGLLSDTMGATDTYAVNIDGFTNPYDFSSTDAGAIKVERWAQGSGTESKSFTSIYNKVYSVYNMTGGFVTGSSVIGMANNVQVRGDISGGTAVSFRSATGLTNQATDEGEITAAAPPVITNVIGESLTASGYMNFNYGNESHQSNTIGLDMIINGNHQVYGVGTTTDLTDTLYGQRIAITQISDVRNSNTLTQNAYGTHVSMYGSSKGTSALYGYYINYIADADTNWGFYNDAGVNNFLGGNNAKIYLGGTGTTPKSSIYNDGVNLVFQTNLTTISNTTTGLAWFSGNVSAKAYITRTSVYDASKGDALNYIKNASDYLSTNEKGIQEINHTAFYGYITYDVTDYSKPIIIIKEVCRDEINQTTQIKKQICNNVNITTYPYTKTEEGVELGKEIDVLRQGAYELNQKVISLEIENARLKDCAKEEDYKLYKECVLK